MAAAVIEFVAGPRCGETTSIDCGSGSLVPPASLSLPASRPGRAVGTVGSLGSVYLRRADEPDPRTRHWLFDHVPTCAGGH